jgi:hypothetical protein
MRKSVAVVSLLALGSLVLAAAQSSFPPPFPRDNATKVLENDRLIAWDVVWPEGEPTAMHQHPYDLVAVFLEGGDRMITNQDSSKHPTTAKAYDVSLTAKGVIHIEEGTSDKPPRAILVELKESAARMLPPVDAPAPTAFPRPGAKQLLDNARVTIWEYKWTLGAPVPLHKHDRDTLVVWFENGKLQSAPLAGAPSVVEASFGKLRYSERGTVHTETAIEGPPHAVIIELK